MFNPFAVDGMTPNFIADAVDLHYVDASKYDNPFDIFFDSERTESWQFIGQVNMDTTGYPRNHNTGLVTDEYGYMYMNDRICVATTSSQHGVAAAMSHLKTYRIYVTTFAVPK